MKALADRCIVRNRGVGVPSLCDIEAIEDSEERLRAYLIFKIVRSLYDPWRAFADGHVSGLPGHANDAAAMWEDFLSAYCSYLWRFKAARRSADHVTRYAVSIRTNLYDEVFEIWREVGSLWEIRRGSAERFYDELARVAVSVGAVTRELHLVREGVMNPAEYLIEYREGRQRATAARHAENREMKAQVFDWLDTNKKPNESLDDVALRIANRIVPLKFRTVREWVGEWRKLRRTSRP